MNSSLYPNYNYVSDILDEIALEGLDGITMDALWLRLSTRLKFLFNVDDNSKMFLWNIIIRLKELEFFEIPTERPSLNYYDYSVTEECVCTDIRVELNEIYPYGAVRNVPGILGSCECYSTRVNVTEEVVQMNITEVESKWGNKLVIVASQDLRNAALMIDDCTPDIDLYGSPVSYEMLERIGRCREIGLVTCGKGSLQCVVPDVKSIFHYLKCLIKHKLVKKQSLMGNLTSTSHASVVYLTRFYEETANENLNILRMTIEELKSRPPNYLMPCEELYSLFDVTKKKRIRKYKTSVMFRKYIAMIPSVPYRTIYPDAPQAEWEKKSKGEKLVRCFKLINPDADLSGLIEKECDSDDEEADSGFLPRGIFYKNLPITFQAYHHIKESGAKGLSHRELGQIMGLNKYFIRALIKRLSADKLCKFYFEADGRSRFKRYIVGEHAETKAAASEIAQILLETTNKSDSNEQQNNKGSPASQMKKRGKISVPKLQEENMSYRGLKRVGLIIKTIKAHRFRLFHHIKKYVHEEEKKEGLTITVDRQTIHKLLKKLEEDGLIKKMIVTEPNNSGSSVRIYTDPSFDPDEKTKERIYIKHAMSAGFSSEANAGWLASLETEFSFALVENITHMQQLLSDVLRVEDKPPSRENELASLHSPKFIRLNILHEFMYYLVYDYTGVVSENQEDMIKELRKTTVLEESVISEMPKLYSNEICSYMFVRPLSNSGKLPGWLLISDLLTRMPLAMMVKIVKITESCPELWKYLNHPIRKYFLVKDLPFRVRRIFFCRRNQTTNFYYDIRRLCFMGLIQFGPKLGKEFYQTLCYVNRKASLLDTTSSPPGYVKLPSDMNFSSRMYEFNTKSDLKRYWMDMFDICMGTKLGVKLFQEEEFLTQRELSKESLKKFYEAKSVEQASQLDKGEIPGDHLGAAGLDSSMFSFLRSNWTGSVAKSIAKKLGTGKGKQITKIPLQKLKEHKKFDKDRKKLGNLRGRWKVIALNVDKVHSAKRIKGKKKLKKQGGRRFRKPSYDETDLEALKLMNTLRVTWSAAEDNLLLLCRVAMMFLCPNLKTFAKIPRSEVRRALRQYVPESGNKTQRAIARRLVYMMKNPTTVRNVTLCLEDLKAMPESKSFDCTQLVQRIKPSAPDIVERQQELFQKFHELVAFLKDRFIDSPNLYPRKIYDLIPNSMEEFFEKFQLDEPEEEAISIRSIREHVIKGTLMSSFCCRSDKTSSAVQLFDIYRQYNEDELQNAIRSLHSNKVITIKKKPGSEVFKSGNVLPLTFSPFKLSFAFQHMLNMKYSHSIYSDSYAQIAKLQATDETEIRVDLNECNVALFLLGSLEVITFKALLPKQIIAFDDMELSDFRYSKMLLKYCKMLDYSESNSRVVCSSGKVISKSEELHDLKKKPLKKRKRFDSEVVQTKKAKLDDLSEACKSSDSQSSILEETGNEKYSRSSRVILYMMREEAKNDSNANLGGKVMKEFVVVNSSQVSVHLKKEKLQKFNEKMNPKIANTIIKNIISRYLYPINLVNENLVLNDMPESIKEAAKNILEFIGSKKELGASIQDLKQNCNNEALAEILKKLTKSKVIVKAGINETRFASQQCSSPWLLSSFKMKRIEREKLKPSEATAVAISSKSDQETQKHKLKGVVELQNEGYNPPACSSNVNNKIKLIIRPWIRIDGSLNRKVLDRFLGTILGFILAHPGSRLSDIMQKFEPYITPIWTKDLVEILEEINCLDLKTVVVLEKASLFSKSHTEIHDKYTGLEDDSCVIVEAKINAITTLGLFIGNKTYSKDFLFD